MSKNVRMNQEINRGHISLSRACATVPVEVSKSGKKCIIHYKSKLMLVNTVLTHHRSIVFWL